MVGLAPSHVGLGRTQRRRLRSCEPSSSMSVRHTIAEFSRGVPVAAVIGAALIGYLVYAEYSIGQRRVAMEQQEAAMRHREEAVFQRAVISAQELLDQVGKSLNHGDITVRGAEDMLDVATGIVEQVKNVETPQTVELVAKLARTASDIHATLGNLEQAYESAKSSRDLLEPLNPAAPNDPKLLSLLYHEPVAHG